MAAADAGNDCESVSTAARARYVSASLGDISAALSATVKFPVASEYLTKIRDRPKRPAELTTHAHNPIAIKSNSKRKGARLRIFASTVLEIVSPSRRALSD
jgi:hypothetical protein